MTLRQIKYKKNRLIGMNQRDAAIAAGYSASMANKQTHRLESVVKSSIVNELDRAGLTDRRIAQQLSEIASTANKLQSCDIFIQMDAEGKTHLNKNSNDFIEIPDHAIRIKALELSVKLKKHLNENVILDQSEHTHLTIVVEDKKEDARGQILSDSETELCVSTSD